MKKQDLIHGKFYHAYACGIDFYFQFDRLANDKYDPEWITLWALKCKEVSGQFREMFNEDYLFDDNDTFREISNDEYERVGNENLA